MLVAYDKKRNSKKNIYLSVADICVSIEERLGRKEPIVTSEKSCSTSVESIVQKMNSEEVPYISLNKITNEVDQKRRKQMIQTTSKFKIGENHKLQEESLQDLLPVLKKEQASPNYKLYVKTATDIFEIFVRNGSEPTPEMLNDLLQIYVDETTKLPM